MYKVDYYRRPNRRMPADEWIKDQDKPIRVSIYGKITDLSNEGLNLLGTNTLRVIQGPDNGLYELRNVSLNWRIGVYHDKRYNSFVLLYGWRHDKNHKQELEGEIEKARQYLHEYLEMEKRRYG